MQQSILLKLARKRTSVRRYDAGRSIAEEDMLSILEAARLAPSAENTQPWRFIVMRDPKVRERLARECFSGIFLATRFAAAAPLIIALCADRARLLERSGEIVQRTAFYQLDCGIAGEHLVLAAAELGIGTCWIGWFNKRKARKILELPFHVEAVALIAMGYPIEGTAARPKVRKPLLSIVSLDRWGTPYPLAHFQDGRKK